MERLLEAVDAMDAARSSAAHSAADEDPAADAAAGLQTMFARTWAPWLDAPGLGATREFDARLRGAMSAWFDMGRARADFDAVLVDAWGRSFEALRRELLERSPEGLAAAQPRAVLSLAVELADRAFGETFQSERYVEAQRHLFEATAGYRFRETELIDDIASAGHFATRREVDEAYRRVDELRREIRALRKASSATVGGAAAPARRSGKRKRAG